jgi:hypothetical protein
VIDLAMDSFLAVKDSGGVKRNSMAVDIMLAELL